jgi:hypothetical protein
MVLKALNEFSSLDLSYLNANIKLIMNMSNTPEHEAQYRQREQRVLHITGIYNGSEGHYRELMDSLIALEQWMVSTFGSGANISRLSDETERTVTERYSPDQTGRTIGDFIDLARDHFAQLMQTQQENENPLGLLPVLRVRLEGTLLPPGEMPRSQTGNVEGWKPPEYAPRLQFLIEFLQRHGIFTDDLIIVTGTNTPTMMRQESYILVEIPRIGKEVLVCNQVGEATFVSERMLGRTVYVSSTKEQLVDFPGIHRIIFAEQGQWEGELAAILFGVNEDMSRKINVEDIEHLRQALIQAKPSAKDWLEMSHAEKKCFHIEGKKLQDIAMSFGIECAHTAYSLSTFVLLGKKIYGEEDPILKEAWQRVLQKKAKDALDRARTQELGEDLEKWKEEVKKSILAAKEWIEKTKTQKEEIKIAGKGLMALATLFGVNGNPVQSRSTYLQLGKRIYGEGDQALIDEAKRMKDEQEQRKPERLLAEELGDDLDKWREEIKKILPTSKEWLEMETPRRKRLRIAGKSPQSLTNLFGVEGSFRDSNVALIELGKKIYGEEDALLQLEWQKLREEEESNVPIRAHAKELGENQELWRQELIKILPTSKVWLALSKAEKLTLKVVGLGMRAIGRIFGVKMNPLSTRYGYLQLGRKIYGEEDMMLREAWTQMQQKKERIMPDAERAAQLGVNTELWKEEIKKLLPTAKEWIQMSSVERKEFKILGIGLNRLARIFRVQGNFRERPVVYLDLGMKIYGEDPLIQAEQRKIVAKAECLSPDRALAEELGEDLEKWRQEIKKSYPSAKDWIEMSWEEWPRFKVAGKGLKALKTLFGLEKNSTHTRAAHIALARKIYKEEEVTTV